MSIAFLFVLFCEIVIDSSVVVVGRDFIVVFMGRRTDNTIPTEYVCVLRRELHLRPNALLELLHEYVVPTNGS